MKKTFSEKKLKEIAEILRPLKDQDAVCPTMTIILTACQHGGMKPERAKQIFEEIVSHLDN